MAGETLQELFFTKYPQKLWGISTKDLDANWAPKRVQITEERRAFYQDQWSAVGKEGSGSILRSLESKVLALGGVINLEEKIEQIQLSENNNITKIVTGLREINLMPKDIVINTTSCTNFSRFLGFETNLKAFRPHITLGRFKDKEREYLEFPALEKPIKSLINCVDVYESEFYSGKTTYNLLRTFRY